MKALVLDLDGLLIDSETVCFEVAQEIVRTRAGETLARADFARFVGRSAPEAYSWLRHRYELRDGLEVLLTERQDRLVEAYERPILLPGAAGLILAASHAALPVAIASSSASVLVETAVRALPFASELGAVVTVDHPGVADAKPSPDVYLVACALLGVAPHTALAVEDSPTGALAGLRAGMRVAVVASSWTVDAAFPDGVIRLPSLHALVTRVRAGLVEHEPPPSTPGPHADSGRRPG